MENRRNRWKIIRGRSKGNEIARNEKRDEILRGYVRMYTWRTSCLEIIHRRIAWVSRTRSFNNSTVKEFQNRPEILSLLLSLTKLRNYNFRNAMSSNLFFFFFFFWNIEKFMRIRNLRSKLKNPVYSKYDIFNFFFSKLQPRKTNVISRDEN